MICLYLLLDYNHMCALMVSDLTRTWNNSDNQDLTNVGSRAQFKNKLKEHFVASLDDTIACDTVGLYARHVTSNFNYITVIFNLKLWVASILIVI